MSRADDLLNKRLKAIPRVDSLRLVFEGERDGLAVVSGSEGSMAIPFVGTVQPSKGDSVHVEMRNGAYVCLGPSRFKPARGKIVEIPAPDQPTKVLVELLNGERIASEIILGYTPALNDNIALAYDLEGPLVIGVVSGLPAAPPVIQPPYAAPIQVYSPSPFPPSHAGGWQNNGGWQTGGNMLVSDSWNTGVWWDQVADTIPDGAQIRSAAIYVSPKSVLGANPKMRLLNGPQTSQASAQGAEFPITAQPGWNAVPAAWVDLMKANRTYGIALTQSTPGQGYHIYRGLNEDPASFSLKVEWLN